jgi:VanZ family protein
VSAIVEGRSGWTERLRHQSKAQEIDLDAYENSEMRRASAGLRTLLPRCAFPACIALLAALSWIPGSHMVRTGSGGHVEHAMAYFLTAIIMGAVSREARWLPVQFLFLVALAALLEVGQLFVPGRTANVLDFWASSTGAAIGVLLVGPLRLLMLSYVGLVHGGRR